MCLSGRSQHAIIYARLIPCHIKRVIKFVSLRLMSCWLTLLRQLTRDITSYPPAESLLHSNFSTGQDTGLEFSPCWFGPTDRAAGEGQWGAMGDPSPPGPHYDGLCGLWHQLMTFWGRQVSVCISSATHAAPLRPVIRARQFSHLQAPLLLPARDSARTAQSPVSVRMLHQSLGARGSWLRLKAPFRLLWLLPREQ